MSMHDHEDNQCTMSSNKWRDSLASRDLATIGDHDVEIGLSGAGTARLNGLDNVVAIDHLMSTPMTRAPESQWQGQPSRRKPPCNRQQLHSPGQRRSACHPATVSARCTGRTAQA